jgi:hypothetical protein
MARAREASNRWLKAGVGNLFSPRNRSALCHSEICELQAAALMIPFRHAKDEFATGRLRSPV